MSARHVLNYAEERTHYKLLQAPRGDSPSSTGRVCRLALCMARLFNKSLLCGRFPSPWKLVHVVPISKKNDRQLVSNYRPVSPLCTISKVFLDVSKAFEKVWHNGLIHKLRQFGLAGPLLKWFSSYLDNRKQQVILDGATSAPATVTR